MWSEVIRPWTFQNRIKTINLPFSILPLEISIDTMECGKNYVIGRSYKIFTKDLMLVLVDREVYFAKRSVNGHCLWYSLILVSDSSPFMQCPVSFPRVQGFVKRYKNERWPDKHLTLIKPKRNNMRSSYTKTGKQYESKVTSGANKKNTGIQHGEYQYISA